MSKITFRRVNAPCPGEIVQRRVYDHGKSRGRLRPIDHREYVGDGEYMPGNDAILIQHDLDFPGVASSFGWSLCDVQADAAQPCNHEHTDGTLDCADCGVTAGEFIDAARNYLEDEAVGMTVDDPGYF